MIPIDERIKSIHFSSSGPWVQGERLWSSYVRCPSVRQQFALNLTVEFHQATQE